MLWTQRLWLRLQTLFRRNRNSQQLDDEIQFHLEQQIAENIARGMSREEARYAAMRTFGNPTFLKEETRDTWGWTWLEQIIQDLRYAARMLRKSPGFTAVAVLTLAFGIGANTAIFSLIDVILLRPLPIHDSDRVVVLQWRAHKEPKTNAYGEFGFCHTDAKATERAGCSFSYPFFEQVHSQTQIFSTVTAFAASPNLHLDRNGERTKITAPFVSGEFFRTLGVRAKLGRMLEPSDDVPGAPVVALLAYGYWQRAFGGERSILGETIYIDRIPLTVVGVSDPAFEDLIPGAAWDVCLPLAFYSRANLHWSEGLNDNASWWLTIVPPSRVAESILRSARQRPRKH
jgi:hypothetical protein